MKQTGIFLGLLFFSSIGHTANLDLTIKLDDQKQGVLRVAVWKKDHFLKDHKLAFKKDKRPIEKSSQAEFHFESLPEGEYALSAFYDLNDNGKLDKNGLGMPIEPYGFSNNARKAFGPPSFSQASFKIGSEDKKLSINLD